MGGRPVTLLDGDIVRKNLSSRAQLLQGAPRHQHPPHRLRGRPRSPRTAASPSAPRSLPTTPCARRSGRRSSRAAASSLVHVATPIEVCEERDRKGLYAKARAGILKEFTGISDPYEEPADAEVVIDTTNLSPEEAAQEILLYLEREGYVGGTMEAR